jgi:hypothetical protein
MVLSAARHGVDEKNVSHSGTPLLHTYVYSITNDGICLPLIEKKLPQLTDILRPTYTGRETGYKEGFFMKLDRNAVNALLALDDDQLRAVIRGLAARSGVTAEALRISEHDIASIRQALRTATDEDIAQAARQLGLTEGGNRHG